ncbi:hypothetical protein [Saccharothrix sp.]|uniref:hypothetical protein n=1 Tax=Saccharothrix sp. TaxID=1873460 RepID=UPI00281162E2|nr:hypothetical protein [Saccharothrix sp.]
MDLLEYCRDRREQLILKPQNEFGGIGVVAGWECDDRRWAELLVACHAALAG